jgi:4-alpha-glucanotransferase
VIVTPGQCWLPESLRAGERLAGLSAALYLLRSDENWGIGDFTDLRGLVELAAERGADVIGLNPLHENFLDDPEQASPYSPASRLVLNPLNIDVTAIPEFARSAAAQALLAQPEFAARLAACRTAPLVDYSGVAALKLAMLRLVYAEFRATGAPARQAEFARARAGRSAEVERTFVFLALREHFARAGRAAAWQQWPAAYRDPGSAAVASFAREHADEVSFMAWLEWVADEQLAAAARAATPMRVGLYRDLAVGADPAGAETWLGARAVVASARIGAPPDIHNPAGQNWGLPPFHPQHLRAQAYRSFIELVRANMRHAGGLRIDHVMALQHAYCIPDGAAPAHGAYLEYPLDDLLGILALESHPGGFPGASDRGQRVVVPRPVLRA